MNNNITSVTRRSFLSRGTASLAGAALVSGFPHIVNAQAAKAIKVGIVGCGGRGSGALTDSMNADPSVVLTAMGDVHADKLEASYNNIKTVRPEQVKVDDKNKFIGFDAIDRVLAADIDIVFLTTPPGFRPAHLHKAINAGKHVFCEKPLGVDATAIRHAMEAVKKAKEKNLAIQTGFCWRFNLAERATWKKLHDGLIGDIRCYYGTYLTSSPWPPKERQADWSDLQYQLRNWLYYTWLSGDHLVEQAVHSVDKMSWAFKDVPPVKCTALGGRQQRIEPEYGDVYDHYAVMYEFPNGGRGFIYARQQAGCSNENSDYIIGANGTGQVSGFKPLHVLDTTDGNRWHYEKNGGPGGTPGEKNQMYVQEHKELIESIRSGKPVNMGEQLAHSSLLAIMGRMSAYTGRTITWEEVVDSKESFAPLDVDGAKMDSPVPKPEVKMPGRYKLV
jgi:myo-inositol 2-dehydrogenase / D-chiro-inositol 1-dehydrogenase